MTTQIKICSHTTEHFNMKKKAIFNLLNIFISMVWIANGLCCKLLNMVPRHELIVEKILGKNYAAEITKLIGVFEILMAIWIISRYRHRLNAIIQIIIISTMNLLEFILASDLLLWGKLNAVFALVFILIIYFNAFHSTKNI